MEDKYAIGVENFKWIYSLVRGRMIGIVAKYRENPNCRVRRCVGWTPRNKLRTQ
jgi:hypothetical protein